MYFQMSNTLNHFSKIDSPLEVPYVSESESLDEHNLITDHATLSTNSKVSEHGN